MRPLADPDRWAASLAAGYDLSTAFIAIDGSGNETELDTVFSGSVTIDQRAAVRTTATLSVAGAENAPTSVASLLAPFGTEVRVERGIDYLDGTSERVSLGVLRIERAEPEESRDGIVTPLTLFDRSQIIIDARFTEPYEVAAGTLLTDAIEDGISEVYSGLETNFVSTSLDTPLLNAEVGDDRWAFFQQAATSAGMELYFDGDGVLVLAPIPTGSTAVADISDSLLRVRPTWSREGIYNQVVATGENPNISGTPPRGVATDDNPDSPTYFYGPFGQKPRFYNSPFIKTDDQAADAAAGILSRSIGTSQAIDFETIVNPALEPGDTVHLTREDLGLDADHVIDSLTIPLDAQGSASGATRATQEAAE